MWKQLWRQYRQTVWILCGIALVYGAMFLLHLPCPIQWMTGVSCPGCGMTRACLSALTFQFSKAFFYHPLWVVLPFVLAALIVFRIWKKKKAEQVLVVAFGCLMLAVWLWRLLAGGSEVVVFHPENGIFVRGIRWLFSLF